MEDLLDYISNLKTSSQEKLSDCKSINAYFSTIEHEYDVFAKGVNDGSINDIQIGYEIVTRCNDFCDYSNFQKPETRKSFQTIWTSKRFLEIFLKLLRDPKKILLRKMEGCNTSSFNRIAYSYYVEIGHKDDNNPIVILLLEIASILNYTTTNPMTIYMKRMDALFITMAKSSSSNKTVCVQRVNDFIIRLGYDLSVDQIIDIYYRLFREDHFGSIFNATMIQIYDANKLGPIEAQVYYRMNNAILTILNSMTSTDIDMVLVGYSNYVKLYQKPVRFSLLDISSDYSRLIDRIYQMRVDDVYIP